MMNFKQKKKSVLNSSLVSSSEYHQIQQDMSHSPPTGRFGVSKPGPNERHSDMEMPSGKNLPNITDRTILSYGTTEELRGRATKQAEQ